MSNNDEEFAVNAVLESLTLDLEASEDSHPLQVDSHASEPTLAEELQDMVCAICLDTVPPEDSAFIKDCQHMYCVGCILKWALVKEDAVSCPKCKSKFSSLYTYRSLDGTLHDFPQEESVCLLRRAPWFEDALGSFKGKALAIPEEPDIPEEWYDEYFEDEDDDDDYDGYMASSGLVGRRHRVMLGNRRWGSNGYIQAGRMQARPVTAPRPSKAEARAARKEKDIACEPGRSRNRGGGKKAAAAGTSPPSGSNSMGSAGPSPSGGGRRARRAAKRAEMGGQC